MEIVEGISEKVAVYIIKQGNLDEKKKAVLSYGVFNMIQPIISIFLTVIFGFIFNVLLEALIISISASLLRKSSGGAHASSAERCLVAGVLIFTVIAGFTKFFLVNLSLLTLSVILVILSFFSVYIIVKYSPVDNSAKPIKDKDVEKFRKKSIKILIVFLLISGVFLGASFRWEFCINISSAIILGVFWQSLTLIRSGEIVLKMLDIFLRKLKI